MSPRSRSAHAASRGAGGFSLIEVMVAVIVLCVGLLGIAKMQALALSSTSTAGQRALAAIQAASLAASMHENRAFWTTTAAGLGAITVTGNVVNNPPAAPPNCSFGVNAPCTPTQLAAFDLQQWAIALGGGVPAGGGAAQPPLLPNPSATITCNPVTPVSCTIQITWTERAVAIGNAQVQAVNNPGAFQIPTYTLFVQP